MRLARINADRPGASSQLAQLASAGQLDLLQLDYDVLPAPIHSAKFFEQFRTLHKHLYLEPNLRLITNAGGGAVTTCIEALGRYLCDHGDGSMLISAVRGDNLLPRLTEMASRRITLVDELAGQLLAEWDETPLAAQVELGAGPLAAAWEEGSRIVVAGCYDYSAPFIAAAKSELGLPWDDYETLARVALAAHACSSSQCVAELDGFRSLLLDSSFNTSEEPHFWEQLKALPESSRSVSQADVLCDFGSLAFRSDGAGVVTVEGAAGLKPTGTWRLRLTYASEDVVDSLTPPRVRWCRVPRDAVAVSVDTRPAVEWF